MLRAQLCKRFGIKQEVYYADFNWDLIFRMLPTKDIKYAEISKYPEVRRDLALVVNNDVTFAQIETLAYQTEKKILKSVSLFDVYTGEKLPENTKQYAVAFVLQDKEKTLTDKQIEATMQKLVKTFEQKLNSNPITMAVDLPIEKLNELNNSLEILGPNITKSFTSIDEWKNALISSGLSIDQLDILL
jgi:phenylalanyl-tRNA synthetase beta chain